MADDARAFLGDVVSAVDGWRVVFARDRSPNEAS